MSARVFAAAAAAVLVWSTPAVAATNFTPPVSVALEAAGAPVVADFDGSGIDDIAFRGSDGGLRVYVADVDGGFAAKTQTVLSGAHLVTGDFDGDGDVDLVTVRGFPDMIEVLTNDGTGTFASTASYTTLGSPSGLAAGDVTGDDEFDLVYTRGSSTSLSVQAGAGNGSFGAGTGYVLREQPSSDPDLPSDPQIGDFDGDGENDVAVLDPWLGAVTVLHGQEDETLGERVSLDVGPDFPRDLVALDVNGDSRPDFATANPFTDDISILVAEAAGGFADPVLVPGDLYSGNRLLAADWDGDGLDDLGVGGNDRLLSVMLSDGLGDMVSVGWLFWLDPSFATESFAVGEFNGDSEPDVVVRPTNDRVNIIFGDPILIAEELDFGGQQIGTVSDAKELFLENVGTEPVALGAVGVNGVDAASFSVTDNGCTGLTLDPGEACSIAVTFAPGAAGDVEAIVTVDSDAPVAPHVGFLAGVGFTPPPVLAFDPAVVDFGTHAGGTTGQRTVTVTNTGGRTATLGQLSLTGTRAASFARTADGCSGVSLDAGETCSVTVTFTPALEAPAVLRQFSAFLEVPTWDPGDTYRLSLRGRAERVARLEVSPSRLELIDGFGPLPAPAWLTVTNTGGQRPRNLATTLIGPDAAAFRITSSTCPPSRSYPHPGDGSLCRIGVGFTARHSGAHAATFNLIYDGQTLSVELAGTGVFTNGDPVRDQLRSGLKRAGKQWRKAGIDRLRKRGFVVRGLAPLTDGRFVLEVRARGRLIAFGRDDVLRGRRLVLEADLTKAGRRLLKKARRLSVTGTLRFRSGPAKRSFSARTHAVLRG